MERDNSLSGEQNGRETTAARLHSDYSVLIGLAWIRMGAGTGFGQRERSQDILFRRRRRFL